MGRNTTRVVSVLATIAAVTSSPPSTAASWGGIPDSVYRKIFSSTTMALSTSIPMPRANPPRLMRFKVKPPKYMRVKVAITEIGIAVATTIVLRIFLRKRSRTRMASTPP